MKMFKLKFNPYVTDRGKSSNLISTTCPRLCVLHESWPVTALPGPATPRCPMKNDLVDSIVFSLKLLPNMV